MILTRTIADILTAMQGAAVRARPAGWMSFFVIPMLIAVMTGVLGSQLQQGRSTGHALAAALDARVRIERFQTLLNKAETGQRGYLLTGDETYLVPYTEARRRLQPVHASLSTSLREPSQSRRLVRLTTLARAKLDELDQTITLRRAGQTQEALLLISTNRGKLLMDQMQQVIDELAAAQNIEIARLGARERSIATFATVVLGTLLIFMISMLILAATTLNRAVADLRDGKRRAEDANRSKSEFLAMMSHELRTPMNGVLGMAHLLSQSDLSAEQAQQLKTIQSSGQGLMVVLNDILDLSKIEANCIELEMRTFDLADLVRGACDLWAPSAEAKGLALTVQIINHSDSEIFEGDPTRIRQIVANLVSNAVKFTAEGGLTVELVVGPSVDDRQSVTISVTDTGRGISDEAASRLFSPFTQADASVTRKFGGTGLGLAIARRLARLMGGDLTLFRRDGSGATFKLDLTLQSARSIDAERQEPDQTAVDLTGLRVLVAEDNLNNQAVVRAYLAAIGAEATVVDDGAQAVEALRSGTFDLVLMDMQMPVMDGATATAAIRRGEGGDPCIRIIALTANAMAGDRDRFLQGGFDDYVAKPIDPREFVAALSRVVAAP